MLKIYSSINQLIKRNDDTDLENKRQAIIQIINQVREQGDQALYALTEKYDGVKLESLKIPEKEIQAASTNDSLFLEAIKEAAVKIRAFHLKQKRESWISMEEDGSILGQAINPIERVGIYVPGGTAAYPSSVLMNAIPAQVAGVKEIVMVTPPNKDGSINQDVLIAAQVLGIKEVYTVGGAQAVAALAYGTATIKPVDKLVGPGNIYVALAKREVFGQIGIDMIAGPSEIAIIADAGANPSYIAADLLSQAEHDPMSQAVLITTSKALAEKVQQEVKEQLSKLSRGKIAIDALANFSGIIIVDSLEEAVRQVNSLAPEHLELLIDNPFNWLGKIKNAGAIFLGEYSPEAVGDYFAGPNHVLPTNGTARFSSPLGVDDFIKKTSIISYSKAAFLNAGEKIIAIANKEGLDAHAQSIKVRLKGEQG